ncbi:MAG TPA: pitrilysin family protein [Polyangiaceae bacterium]|nr:pitrilysin family protein [Polyangiaceae bacterium]
MWLRRVEGGRRHGALAAVLLAAWSTIAAAEPGSAPQATTTRYQLQNGLRVVLAPDRVTPGVSVVVRYDVGAANAPRGYRGLSHLLEHLTFRGSRHVAPLQGMSILQELGAGFNATTELEATEYYAQVSAPALDTVLWLESERMAFTLDRLDQAALDVERRIVDNEHRQRHTISKLLHQHWLRALYGEGHPFVEDPSAIPDLSEVTLRGVQWFFQTAYRPDNATLVLVGQFDPPQALHSIEQYFGPIVPPPLARTSVQASAPRLCGMHRLGLSHASLFGHRLRITWPLPRASSAPERASENVLERRLASKLHGLLVERGVDVTNVNVFLNRFTTHSLLSVDLELHDKADAAVVEQVTLATASELAQQPLSPQALRSIATNLISSAIFNREDGLGRARKLASGIDPDADTAALRLIDNQQVLRAARPLGGPVLVVHMWPSKREDGTTQIEEDDNPCP